MKIKKIIYLPQLLQNKILLFFTKKKLGYVGSNCRIQSGFEIYGEKYISIGSNFIGGERIRLYAWNLQKDTSKKIIIEDDVCITEGCYLSAAEQIIIESGSLLGNNVFITDNFHGKSEYLECQIPPIKRQLYVKGPVKIGKNVWVGRNVCIMPRVKIGDGVIIGANSVVTHDIPKNCVAVGIPAKVIKHLE